MDMDMDIATRVSMRHDVIAYRKHASWDSVPKRRWRTIQQGDKTPKHLPHFLRFRVRKAVLWRVGLTKRDKKYDDGISTKIEENRCFRSGLKNTGCTVNPERLTADQARRHDSMLAIVVCTCLAPGQFSGSKHAYGARTGTTQHKFNSQRETREALRRRKTGKKEGKDGHEKKERKKKRTWGPSASHRSARLAPSCRARAALWGARPRRPSPPSSRSLPC